MTSQPLSLDNGLPSLPKQRPVVVQVQELPLCSPTKGGCEDVSHGLVEVVGKYDDGFVESASPMSVGSSLKRPYSGGGHDRKSSSGPILRRRASSVGSLEEGPLEQEDLVRQRERLTALFKTRSVDNGTPPVTRLRGNRHHGHDRDIQRTCLGSTDNSAGLGNLLGPLPMPDWFPPSQDNVPRRSGSSGVVPLLTPPEDVDSFKWESPTETEAMEGVRSVSNVQQSRSQGRAPTQHRTSSTARPSEIQLPESSNMTGDDPNRSNWLRRACQHLGE